MPRVLCEYVGVYAYRQRGERVEFLQIRRAPGQWMADTWQPVHGHIRAGETSRQAALRELYEETRLRPVELYQLESVNTFYDATDDAVHHCPSFAALVPADAAVVLDDEHTAHRWVPSDEAPRAFLWPGQRHAVREIIHEIIHEGPAKPYMRVDPSQGAPS